MDQRHAGSWCETDTDSSRKGQTETAGFRVSLRAGAADRSARPVQRFILDVRAPQGPAAAVISAHTVRAQAPALGTYGAILILCESVEIVRIKNIGTAR